MMALLVDEEVSELRRVKTFLSPLEDVLSVVIAILVTCICLVILTPSILCMLASKKARDNSLEVLTYPWHHDYPEFR